MMLPIKLYVSPHEGLEIPETLSHKGVEITVAGYENGCVTLLLNEDLTLRDHIRAVEYHLGDGHSVSREPPVTLVELNIVAGDLAAMKPLGKPIWESIFRKPQPVLHIHEWYASSMSDEYVYLPNNLLKQGADMEEYTSNAMYTEVLTHAYRLLCKKVGIQPFAILANGSVLDCASVQPSHGLQMTVAGNRAGRLANSRLDDFDDSPYAREFIEVLISLGPQHYESEIVKRKVLSKAENILFGKASHTHNQRFIQRLLDNTSCSDVTALLNILTGMVTDGLVLEDSAEEFMARVARSPLSAELNTLCKQYGERNVE